MYTKREIISMFEAYKKSAMIYGDTEEDATESALECCKKYNADASKIINEYLNAIPDSEEDQTVVTLESKTVAEKDHPTKNLVETKVDTKPEDQKSDMAQGRQAVIRIGNTTIDPNKINQNIAEKIDPSNPARVMLQQEQQIPNMVPQQPPVMPVNTGMFNPGMVPQQQPGTCSCGDPNCMGGHGDIIIPMKDKIRVLHRIDEAPKEKPQVAKPDNVDVELKDVDMTKGIMAQKVKMTKPGFIEPLPNGIPINPGIDKNVVDNSPLINKVDKVPLKAIEEIANQNGHSVAFYEYPNADIISVLTYGADGNIVQPKSFCIDLGHVIDARAKLISACPMIPNQDQSRQVIEFSKFYELFIIDPKSHKKVLDTQLLNDMFSAGYLNVKKRPMYSDEYLALNRKLALITIPTKGLNKEQRNAIQSFLIDTLDKGGYLDKAISLTPGGCRFMFSDKVLDKNNLANFKLSNVGVPQFFGTQAHVVVPTEITVKDGKVTIFADGKHIDFK